jgi:hypothetical protein
MKEMVWSSPMELGIGNWGDFLRRDSRLRLKAEWVDSKEEGEVKFGSLSGRRSTSDRVTSIFVNDCEY